MHSCTILLVHFVVVGEGGLSRLQAFHCGPASGYQPSTVSHVVPCALQVPVAADGHLELYTTPLTHLSHDFCHTPRLMGNLVPQQMNLWMGIAPSGTLAQ